MSNSISLSLYTIRIRLIGEQNNLPMRGFDHEDDILDDMLNFLNDLRNRSYTDPQNQRRLTTHLFRQSGRTISGIVDTGDFGYESSLVNVDDNTIAYNRGINEAEMLPFYFICVLPRGTNEGLIAFQRLGQRGIKTYFSNIFSDYFEHSHPNYKIELNEIYPEQVLNKLTDEGVIRKVRLIRFGVPADIEEIFDEPQRENEGTTELVIRARRNGNLNLISRFREIMMRERQITHFVEIENFEYQTVKVEFAIDGKKRVIDLSDLDHLHAIYDITEDVRVGVNGHPEFDSIDSVAYQIIRETYHNMGIGDENVD